MTVTLDTAVVGAGIGGAYSAWRLATEERCTVEASRVALFEQSDRIGGRLLTVSFPGMPHVPTELGGMRLLSSQDVMMGLTTRLGVKLIDFPMGDDNNLAYVRGQRFPLKDFNDPQVVPYDLPPWERGLSPAEIMSRAIDKIVPGATQMPPEVLRAVCRDMKIDGIPLRDYGFWSLLLQELSIEGYNMALIGGGYNTLLSNWNCADAIPWYLADFPVTIRYYAPAAGMQQIPEKLCHEFQDAGGELHLGHQLLGFHKAEDGLIDLVFHDGHREQTYRAKRLVLALPKWALSQLAMHSPEQAAPNAFFADPAVAACLDSVSSRNLFKFALAYEQPWWHMLNLTSGRSVTDLPLRQVYYFLTEGDQPGADPKNRNSYLDCSYSDGVSVGYWEGVRRTGPKFETRPNPFVGPEAAINPNTDVSRQMVKRATEQLAEVHGIPNLPEPYAALCMDWNDAPYGGGWHSWNIGVDSSLVMKKVRHPVEDFPVYICGESYSSGQGWAEGAVQTAERMLQEHFGLPMPHWLADDADLGP